MIQFNSISNSSAVLGIEIQRWIEVPMASQSPGARNTSTGREDTMAGTVYRPSKPVYNLPSSPDFAEGEDKSSSSQQNLKSARKLLAKLLLPFKGAREWLYLAILTWNIDLMLKITAVLLYSQGDQKRTNRQRRWL